MREDRLPSFQCGFCNGEVIVKEGAASYSNLRRLWRMSTTRVTFEECHLVGVCQQARKFHQMLSSTLSPNPESIFALGLVSEVWLVDRESKEGLADLRRIRDASIRGRCLLDIMSS